MGALNMLGSIVSYGFQRPPGVPVQYSYQTAGDDLWLGNEKDDPYSVATALRCMSIIASAVAGCPLRAVDVNSREVVPIQALQPSEYWPTNYEIIETMVLHLAGWGNAIARKQRDASGNIIGLGPIHPSTVKIDFDRSARDAGMPIEKRFALASGEELTSDDILHIPGPSDDGVMGLSVVSKAARVLTAARENDKTAEKLGRQGLRIPGILRTDQKLEGEQADNVAARWKERTAGSDNAGRVPVLGSGLDFKQIDLSPSDAQFLESRKFSVSEIARLFGLPGWMINDQEKSTSWGSGMEQQFISFVTLTLKPYMQRIERRVTQELLDYSKHKAEFKVEGLLRGDSKSRAAFYASGVQHGWLVPNDIRPLEDMTTVPWGDDPYLPYNQSATSQTEGVSDDDDN